MTWGWLLTAIRCLLGFFGGGKGTRITFEARPEISIEKEQKKLAGLRQKLKEKKRELDKATLEDCRARRQGLLSYANNVLAPKCQQLRAEYDTIEQEYLAAGGLPAERG